jgi:hypothetical protein
MNMPGFDAESSLGPTMGIYWGKAVCGRFPSEGSGGVMPQLGFQSAPDLGAYWRYGANGGRSHMPFLWRASSLHNRWLPDVIDR